MKKLLKYFKEFLKEDFHWGLYLYAFVFTGIAVYINYHFSVKSRVIDGTKGNPIVFLYYAAFYGIAYYGIIIPRAFITGDKTEISSRLFWKKSLLFVGATAFISSFYFQNEIIKLFSVSYERYFVRHVLFYLKRPVLLLVPLLLTLQRQIRKVKIFRWMISKEK